MKDGVLGKVTEVGVAAVQLGGGVEQVKEAVTDAVEDRVRAAKRAVKPGRRAAEDLVDEAEIKTAQEGSRLTLLTFELLAL